MAFILLIVWLILIDCCRLLTVTGFLNSRISVFSVTFSTASNTNTWKNQEYSSSIILLVLDIDRII